VLVIRGELSGAVRWSGPLGAGLSGRCRVDQLASPGASKDGPRREDGGTGGPSRSCPIRYSWNDTDLAAANAVVRRDVYWGARRCGEQAHRVSVDRLLILCLTSDEH